MWLTDLVGRLIMRKGRVTIDFESDDAGKCSWNIQQECEEQLDNDNLVSLF